MQAQPGVTDAEVEIVWDEAWTTDRLSPRAARLLRFLPPPAQAGDPAAYLAAHMPARGEPS
jgi:metal-sulfur cluster biosynthetic enzyme